jgi:hypothetical protein
MEIIVSSRQRDTQTYGVQKYDNDAEWNVKGGQAPNGVCATRWLRRTNADISALSPLAAWLVAHCPKCVAGRMPHSQLKYRVRCFDGMTQADHVRKSAETPHGTGWVVNGVWYRDQERARDMARQVIECYGLEKLFARCDDWLFDIIEPEQDDTTYWNAQASKMINAGVTRIVIGDAEWVRS